MIFSITKCSTGEVIYLEKKKEYVVGRKNCDILLQNDQSISRQHAILQVKDDKVTVKDCNSKYHTLLNGNQMKPETEVEIKNMDTIQFGIYENKFRFECYKMLVAASSLNTESKVALKSALQKCAAKYTDNWSEHCTHLTVDKLTLTPKVLHALIDGKPIVTLKYWFDYASSLEQKTPLPDIENYKDPPMGEQLLSSDFSFKYDPRRNTLFENKAFIFLSLSIKNQMQEVIRKCGGTCIAWETEPKTIFEMNTSDIEYLVVRVDIADEENESFRNLIKEYVKDKRAIPLAEIPLAIVYCSCEVNCNPSFNKASQVFHRQTQRYPKKDVLVPETETMNLLGPNTEKVIPPSLGENLMDVELVTMKSQDDVGKSSKRGNIEESFQEREAKKIKLDQSKKKQKDFKQPTIDSFIGRKSSSTSMDSNDSSVKEDLKKPETGTQKRKALDEPDTAPCLKPNPFSLIKSSAKRYKSEEEHNPFQSGRSKADISKTSDNPFTHIKLNSTRNTSSFKDNHEKENVFQKVPFKNEPGPLASKTSDISDHSTSKRTVSLCNSSWLSKNSIKTEVVVKIEDPEIEKYIEAFKNCVKIETLPVFERTIELSVTIQNDGVKNFKKFKKCQPLRPQVTIYSRNQLRRISIGDVTGLDVNQEENSDGEQPQGTKDSLKSSAPSKAKPRGKRFMLL